MNQKKLEECGKDASNFIKNYVEKHKKELEKLRENADALKFEGQWFIIGDDGYLQKRLQYATTSFEEADVSPRIILYPAGETGYPESDGPVSRAWDGDCRAHGRTPILRLLIDLAGKHAD